MLVLCLCLQSYRTTFAFTHGQRVKLCDYAVVSSCCDLAKRPIGRIYIRSIIAFMTSVNYCTLHRYTSHFSIIIFTVVHNNNTNRKRQMKIYRCVYVRWMEMREKALAVEQMQVK